MQSRFYDELRICQGLNLYQLTFLCGFSNAKWSQIAQLHFHRHTESYATAFKEGESGFSCSYGKGEGKNECR